MELSKREGQRRSDRLTNNRRIWPARYGPTPNLPRSRHQRPRRIVRPEFRAVPPDARNRIARGVDEDLL